MALHHSEYFTADLDTSLTQLGSFIIQETAGSTAEVNLRSASLGIPTTPSAAAENLPGLVEAGTHSYKITNVTAEGESAPSLVSNTVTAGPTAPTALTAANANVDGIVEAGTHLYKVTFVTATGETAGGTVSASVTVGVDAPGACTAALAEDATGSQLEAGTHSYKVTFVTASGETAAGTASNVVTNDGTHTSNALTAIPTGPTGTASRKLYRTEANGSDYKLLATIADNSTTTYTDTTPDASLTTAAPSSNTSKGQVSLTGIPVGPTGTTQRKVYRNEAGGAPGTYKLKATIADNSTTTATDNVADATGATMPSSNTSGGKVTVTCPLGPAGTVTRNLYRTLAGAGTWVKVPGDPLPDNTTASYLDNVADGSLSGAIPTTDTTGSPEVSLKFVANETKTFTPAHPIVWPSGTVQVEVVSGAVAGTIAGA